VLSNEVTSTRTMYLKMAWQKLKVLILNCHYQIRFILQPYRPPRPVTGIALLLLALHYYDIFHGCQWSRMAEGEKWWFGKDVKGNGHRLFQVTFNGKATTGLEPIGYRGALLTCLLQVNVYVTHNLLNVLVQIANRMELKKIQRKSARMTERIQKTLSNYSLCFGQDSNQMPQNKSHMH
jgi:hypothetical protein